MQNMDVLKLCMSQYGTEQNRTDLFDKKHTVSSQLYIDLTE